MADLEELLEQMRQLDVMRQAGIDMPDFMFHHHVRQMRGRYNHPAVTLFDKNPFAATSMVESELQQQRGRRVDNQAKPKRRPTGKPLIAVGMDRRVAVPTDALAEYRRRHQPNINVSAVIVPEKKVIQGTLIAATTIAWAKIAETLKGNWSLAFEIPSDKWEELIAGAYERAGYDQVILTPRSGDYGRDVIAVKNGVGCIKIIGSVKAYGSGKLVKHDDVRALLGVLAGEQDASKGIITTTSEFAPRIATDPFIKPFLPTRLELMNGERLQQWLSSLIDRPKYR